MGTRQGHGPQGSNPQGQQSDRRPQQDRDLQRNKQSDRGQHGQQGQESPTQQSQLGGAADFMHKTENEGREQNREQQDQWRQQSAQGVQGEGNYAASRHYDDATKKFTESGRVEPAARAAAPRSDADSRDMAAAENEGKRRSKGEDPALNRKSTPRPPESPDAPRPGKEEE
jgi:hypothetical protein